MISVDLGQSGARVRIDGKLYTSARAQRPGGRPVEALVDIFQELPKSTTDVVALSLSGFNGIVRDVEETAEVCHEALGAHKVAIIDDGLAGYFGTQGGADGVTLLIGGGVVCIGCHNGTYTHRDGLGSIFGDEGGGYWIGSRGIQRALASRQGRDVHEDLARELTSAMATYDNLHIKNGDAAVKLAIESAELVLNAADKGIPAAMAIRDEGARLLARTVISAWKGTGADLNGKPSVIIYGGLSKNAAYKSAIEKLVAQEIPHAIFNAPHGDNLDGAEWIAHNISSDIEPLMKWVRF